MITGRKLFGIGVVLSFLYIASPLIFPMALGGVLAVLFAPWLDWLERKRVSRGVGSALLTLGITVVLILPASLLVFFAVKSGFYQLQAWKKSAVAGGGLIEGLLSTPGFHKAMLWITHRLPINMIDLSNSFEDLAAGIGTRLTDVLGGMLTHLPAMTVGLLVIVVSVYFFLMDGPRVLRFVRRNTFFSAEQTEQLLQTIGDMCRSVILAAVMSGGVQALLEVLTCVLTGAPNAAFVGLLVFLASFIPLVGASPVTLMVALQQFLEGRQTAGITLLIMSVVILGVDNTIRPLFLRGSANLHPFLGFVAAFGGLQTIGFLGVFLGPIIAALFVVTVQILMQEHEENESV
jgi:predicted PurR-regulated permease PerM